MIPFVINYHRSIYPYVSLEKDQVYYCPGHNVENIVNSTDNILRVSYHDVKEYFLMHIFEILFHFQNINYGFELSILEILMCKFNYLVKDIDHSYKYVSNFIQ